MTEVFIISPLTICHRGSAQDTTADFTMLPLILAGAGLAVLYLYHVQRGMSAVPADALALSPRRWTVDEIKAAYDKAIKSPVDVTKALPPKQNRRYIIVGGSGGCPIP